VRIRACQWTAGARGSILRASRGGESDSVESGRAVGHWGVRSQSGPFAAARDREGSDMGDCSMSDDQNCSSTGPAAPKREDGLVKEAPFEEGAEACDINSLTGPAEPAPAGASGSPSSDNPSPKLTGTEAPSMHEATIPDICNSAARAEHSQLCSGAQMCSPRSMPPHLSEGSSECLPRATFDPT
jgi:hypothetical protein